MTFGGGAASDFLFFMNFKIKSDLNGNSLLPIKSINYEMIDKK